MSTETLSLPTGRLERQAYSVIESAIMLGVSEWTVRNWIHAGKLPSARVGPHEKILIPRAALERLLGAETREVV